MTLNPLKRDHTHIPVEGIMPISPELLEILVCPVCKEPVNLTGNEDGLKCQKCKRVYPVKDSIPVMLVDEANIED